MSTTVKISMSATQTLARWRAQTEEQKREDRLTVVVDRVASSMAMENERVSDEWIEQTKQIGV